MATPLLKLGLVVRLVTNRSDPFEKRSSRPFRDQTGFLPRSIRYGDPVGGYGITQRVVRDDSPNV